jgi:hypothetical protein
VTAFAQLARKTAPRQRERLAMSRSSDIRFNQNCAVYFAMLKAGYKRKAKMSPTDYARRQARELLLQQKRYCDIFRLWRFCQFSACHRHRTCSGEPSMCLKRSLARVPREVQLRAREDIVKATPRNLSEPEREARKSMPVDCHG